MYWRLRSKTEAVKLQQVDVRNPGLVVGGCSVRHRLPGKTLNTYTARYARH